ncbi:MAG: hypothetical protein AB7O32_06830 [Vicinamibacterales bacterium]
MKMRYLTSLGALVTAVIAFVQAPASGQARDYKAPRTSWGHPDLQGVWNNTVSTPLERPSRFKDKAFLTDEELAAYTQERQGSREMRDSRKQADGTVTDLTRAYNALWFPVPEAPIRRTSLVSDPPDGRIPRLTPQAIARAERNARAIGATGSTANPLGRPEGVEDGTEGGVDGRGGRADNPEDRDLGDRCITDDLPRMPGGYNNHMQIVQSPDFVQIQIEMRPHVRTIPLDGRPHLPKAIHQWYGDPRGRWEGDTLVIETTNFHPDGNFKGAADNLHLVERLTRVDANTINYQATMTDPTTWERPWSVEFPWRSLNSMIGGIDGVEVAQMFEYACHEGNYAMENLLKGQRNLDRRTTTRTKQ